MPRKFADLPLSEGCVAGTLPGDVVELPFVDVCDDVDDPEREADADPEPGTDTDPDPELEPVPEKSPVGPVVLPFDRDDVDVPAAGRDP